MEYGHNPTRIDPIVLNLTDPVKITAEFFINSEILVKKRNRI